MNHLLFFRFVNGTGGEERGGEGRRSTYLYLADEGVPGSHGVALPAGWTLLDSVTF